VDGTRWFGRYRLDEMLGRGATGEVWRAFDPATRRAVALKVLRANPAVDHVSRLRFRQEAKLLAGLEEPHVARIHDFGEIEGRMYVTTQLIDGQDLRELLQDGPLSPTRAVWIVEQVASALHAAHGSGVLHRDVKPSNILIAEDDLAYLIDFAVPAGTDSWAYMAPERFYAGAPSALGDVYALTCVLFESLTGEPPFPGAGSQQVAAAHKFKPVPRPSRIRPALPAALDDVIATGMAKDSHRRYGTAKQLARAARVAVARWDIPESSSLTPLVAAQPAPPPQERSAGPGPAVDAPPTLQPAASADAEPAAQRLSSRANVIFGILTSLVIVALVAGVFVVAHAAFGSGGSPSGSKRPSTSVGTTPPLVDDAALEGLLLSPDEVNAAFGGTAMAVTQTENSLNAGAGVNPARCLSLVGVAQGAAYPNGGDVAVRAQTLRDGGDDGTHQVSQAVVRFPSAANASAFFDTSARQWRACREYTDSANDSKWAREQMNNVNGMLSAITVRQNVGAPGWACERALVAKFNVIVDIEACTADPSNIAVAVARQILAKVPV
jgi:serine/threonine kinase PknH